MEKKRLTVYIEEEREVVAYNLTTGEILEGPPRGILTNVTRWIALGEEAKIRPLVNSKK